MTATERQGFTATLRRQLMAALDIVPCASCGHAKKASFRRAARDVGVSPSTVWRFLDGEEINSKSLDQIVAYVQKKGIPQ